MANLSAIGVLSTVFTFCLTAAGFASGAPMLDPVETDEVHFKRLVIERNVVPLEYRDHLDSKLDIAWRHQRETDELIDRNVDLYPGITGDRVIPCMDGKGYNSAFHSNITVALSMLIPEQGARILQIGSCYGFDAIVLVKTYPQLTYTAVDSFQPHLDKMQELINRSLDDEQKTRIIARCADILNLESLNLEKNFFDVVIFSNVLHRYNRDDIATALNNVYPLVKPSGQVITQNIACAAHLALKFVHYFWRGYGPYPGDPVEFVKEMFTPGKKIPRLFCFKPEDMDEIVRGRTEFQIILNKHIGFIAEDWIRSKKKYGGLNVMACYVYTVLEKPEEPIEK